MSVSKKDLYRGRHKWRPLLVGVLTTLTVLLCLAVALFFYLQRFIVYSPEGLSLEIPFLTGESTKPSVPTPGPGEEPGTDLPPVEIVIDSPDYTAMNIGAGEGLGELKALYVPASKVNAEDLALALQSMTQSGAGALVLEMKPKSGLLTWASGAYMAGAYGASGSQDLSAAIASLKAGGAYLVAELSVCLDDLMAVRNMPLALRSETGTVFADTSGSWLDPYNKELRTYISDLMTELSALGFDEILLSNLRFPVYEGTFSHSADLTATDKISVISNLAYSLVRAFKDTELKISVLCEGISFREEGKAQETGQLIENLANICDRIYAGTSGETAEGDRQLFSEVFGQTGVPTRYVPAYSGAAGSGSYLNTAY